MKKLFSAPTKKTNSVENCHNDSKSKEKIKKFTSPDSVEKKEKKNKPPFLTNTQTIEKKKPKESVKNVPKSLTDEEYSDIFSSVLSKALDEDSVSGKYLENLSQSTPELVASTSPDCEDDLDVIATDTPIDQWNDRSEESNNLHQSTPTTKNKEKLKISPNLHKKEKKSKKCFDKKDLSNKKGAKDSSKVTDPVKSNEDDEEDESGTWIQCSVSDCGKWRYVEDVDDPTSVPDYWDCSMNSDKNRNSCDAPEQEYDESEHILTKFTLGSVVWAKMDGFPWWPGMIDTDPDYDTYFELPTATSMMPHMYHVTFFDEHVSRAWLRSHLITPYDHKSLPPRNKVTIKSHSTKKDVQTAITNAEKALRYNLQDRLDKYSFVKRYSKSKKAKKPDSCKKSKKEKSKLSREILSPSNDTMLKELEMAIETCNKSDDADFSEEDEDYLPQPTHSRQTSFKERKSASFDNVKQKEKHNDQSASSSDSESESEAECAVEIHKQKGNKQKGKNRSGNQFDPDIFTMELDSYDNNHQETQDEIDIISVRGCDDDVKVKPEVTHEVNQTNVSKRTVADNSEGVVESNDKSKSKCKVESKNDGGKSQAKSKKRKSDGLEYIDKEQKKEKLMKKESPIINQDVLEHSATDMDSEKENRDPQKSKGEKPSLSLKKRKNDSESNVEDSSKKQKAKSESCNDQAYNEDQCSKRKEEETGVIRKDDNESQKVCSNKKKHVKKHQTNIVNKINQINKKSNDTDTESKSREKDKQKLPEKMLNSNKEKVDDTKHKQISNKSKPLTKTKDKNAVSVVRKEATEETQAGVGAKQKGRSKSNGFVAPAKDKCIPKSDDGNVPSCPSVVEKDRSNKTKPPQDQFVPDVTDEFVEDELDFSCNEIENSKGCDKSEIKESMAKKEDSEEEDELNLSMDSLEDNCLNMKDRDNGNSNSSKDDQREYGRFGGHCGDHGSDSDPFELIED